MVLKNLLLSNFRNFSKKKFEFSSQTSLIIGKNASGKTNLLEAVYLLATGHSFRGGQDQEMISYYQEKSDVSCQLLTGNKLEIILTKGEVSGVKTPRKRYLVNGVGKRMIDFVGNLRVVLFRPEDLEIIIDSPSIRRGYLDSVLEQVDREYRRASLSYQKGLRQRNKVLEQIREKQTIRSALFFWDKLLIENGTIINSKRKEFIEFINDQPVFFRNFQPKAEIKKKGLSTARGKHFFGDLEVQYDQSLISPERLKKYEKEEVQAGMSLVGPHRDDFRITSRLQNRSSKRDPSIYGSRGEPQRSRNLSVYGSRGEQRLAVFSLKLAELEFVTQKTESRPVLLLDDIFSELDETNRERLLEVIPRQQTLITTTDLDVVEPKFRKKMEKIKL